MKIMGLSVDGKYLLYNKLKRLKVAELKDEGSW